MGCWFTLNLAAAVDPNGDYSQPSRGEGASPSDQLSRYGQFGPNGRQDVFFATDLLKVVKEA
jgi:hypothetical protein